MNTMTTITIPSAVLEQALEALDVSRRFVYQDSRPQVDAAFDALSAALAAPATEPEPAEQQDDGSNVVWKATNIYGETAHFGVHSAAKAWARSGTVAPVKIRDLRLVPTPDVPCKTCEALSRAVLLDQVSDDRRIAPEQPAWHDAPTCAGLWTCQHIDDFSATIFNDYEVANFVEPVELENCRWYGPIPQDKEGGAA